MKKTLLSMLLILLMLCCTAALAEPLPEYAYAFSGEVVESYDSPTLRFDVERVELADTLCYVTKVWMAEPGRQIKKATATWEKSLLFPSEMAKKIPGAALVINGSGYVSPTFPGIPDNYPGGSSDYFYTPLGSLTITDGEVFRSLTGVPFYGLTLQADGLHLHVGDTNEDVLAQHPTQTWSFYELCPMIREHESILDTSWPFANRRAIRTIIAKMDDNNYLIFTVTHKTSIGLALTDCVYFLQASFDPVWAYDLDGGPSSALLCRRPGRKTLKTIYGNNSKDADIMAFVE